MSEDVNKSVCSLSVVASLILSWDKDLYLCSKAVIWLCIELIVGKHVLWLHSSFSSWHSYGQRGNWIQSRTVEFFMLV